VSEPDTPQGRKALEGLRAFWAATGQTDGAFDPAPVGLECADDERGCTANVGFDGFAESVEPTTNTTEAIDRLRRAWKATLAKEGKLHDPDAEVDPGA
jgi:hypothetical protein